MANELRVRQNNLGGRVENNPLAVGDTSLTSSALAAAVVVGATQHLPIILDPDGITGAPEIAYITAHTAGATTATLLRGREGTTARQHRQDTEWIHGPLVTDQPGSGAKVLHSAGYTYPNGADTVMAWGAEDYDTDGYHDNTTNNSRLTAPTNGLYLVGFSLRSDPTTQSARIQASIRKNSVIVPGGSFEIATVGTVSSEFGIGGSAPTYMTAGQYVEVYLFHNTGSTRNAVVAESGFWIARVSG